jgi:tRNA(Ile)-lysidine synthase
VASAHHASAVLTAHTQDDQAETLLLRLTRGTGLRGAGAVRELSHRRIDGARVTLLRPLLTASREATLATCVEWDVTPASDGSNRSMRYARNRVRRRVLAELAQINPDVRAALAAFASYAQADDDLLERLARDAVAGDELRGSDGVRWSTATLSGLPAPLLARVLQAAWASLRGEGAVLARTKITAVGRIIAGRAGVVELAGGGTVMVEQDRVTMRSVAVAAQTFAPEDLAIPGTVVVGAWQVTAQTGAGATEDGDAWRVTLDADAVGDVVCVRSRARGDRFQPLGMANDVRLQDVLVNAKVPRSERDGWPLVVGERGIAWVPGVRIAEWAKVTPQTRRMVAFEAKRLVDGLGF